MPPRIDGNGNDLPAEYYKLESRIYQLEKEVERLNNSYNTIISKLDSLPKEIVAQIKTMIETELRLHVANCPLPSAIREELLNRDVALNTKHIEDNKKAGEEAGFQQWVIKNLVSILAMGTAIVATVLGLNK